MIEYIKNEIRKIYVAYIDDYKAAGLYQQNTGIHGVNIPKKSDVRRAMLMDVGALLEVAKLEGITNKQLGVSEKLAGEAKDAKKDDNNPINEVDLN